MLKFNINGTEFRVRWQHFTQGPKKARGTDCEVFANGELIGLGQTKLHKWDDYDKEKGRRISLSRALENAGLAHEDRIRAFEHYDAR